MFKVGARGFTLIEILIVIAFFAAGAVVLLQIFSMGLYGSVDNENTMIATALAQEKMEEMRNTHYDFITDRTETINRDNTSFTREVRITPVRTNLEEVRVNVIWHKTLGDVNISTVTVVTYVSNVI